MHWYRQILSLLAFGLISSSASADAVIVVCYNWGCWSQKPASFSEPWLHRALQPLRQAKTPEDERAAAAEVVHRFYRKAAEQTPIGADEPGNNEDPSVNGRMDCIDHSTTTKNILSYLQSRGLLRWHEVGPYAHRTLLVTSHYSATLVQKDMDDDDARIFVIDPWDVDADALPQLSSVREWTGTRILTLETQNNRQSPLMPLSR